MGKTIQVTSAQVNAARLWIERADRDGTPIPDAIRKLANATPRPVIRNEPTLTATETSPRWMRAKYRVSGSASSTAAA